MQPVLGLLNNQSHYTVLKASYIALELGTKAFTPTLIPISQALYGYAEYERAEAIGRLALDSARSIEDEAAALRWLGRMRLEGPLGESSEGEQFLVRALNIDKKYNLSPNAPLALWVKAMTQFDWALALAASQCEVARTHFSEVVRILNSAPHTQDLDQLRSNIRRQFTNGIRDQKSCLPGSDTPPIL